MNTQPQPVAISVALGTVLMTGVALAALLLPALQQSPELQVALIAFGNAVIGLGVAVWANRRVTPVAAPRLPAGTAVSVQGTGSGGIAGEDKVIIEATPPGPIGVEGAG